MAWETAVDGASRFAGAGGTELSGATERPPGTAPPPAARGSQRRARSGRAEPPGRELRTDEGGPERRHGVRSAVAERPPLAAGRWGPARPRAWATPETRESPSGVSPFPPPPCGVRTPEGERGAGVRGRGEGGNRAARAAGVGPRRLVAGGGAVPGGRNRPGAATPHRADAKAEAAAAVPPAGAAVRP